MNNREDFLSTAPGEFLKLNFGPYMGGFTSKLVGIAKPYKFIICIVLLVLGFSSIGLGLIFHEEGFVAVGFLLLFVSFFFSISVITYWRDKKNCIQNFYVFREGFVWDVIDGGLLQRTVVDFKEVEYIDLKIVKQYIYGCYKGSYYHMKIKGLIGEGKIMDLDYKFKSIRLHESEKNEIDSPLYFTWKVCAMRLIYAMWLKHK